MVLVMIVVAVLVLFPCVVQSFIVAPSTGRPMLIPVSDRHHSSPPVARTHVSSSSSSSLQMLQGIKDFFQELDKFMDDASARRLGNGAAFYGKRKSNFYGTTDKNKKVNANIPDPTEDYQAPNIGGYFQWMPDESGQLRPVTRMKQQIVERNMNFWDKVYDNNNNTSTTDNNNNKQ